MDWKGEEDISISEMVWKGDRTEEVGDRGPLSRELVGEQQVPWLSQLGEVGGGTCLAWARLGGRDGRPESRLGLICADCEDCGRSGTGRRGYTVLFRVSGLYGEKGEGQEAFRDMLGASVLLTTSELTPSRSCLCRWETL